MRIDGEKLVNNKGLNELSSAFLSELDQMQANLYRIAREVPQLNNCELFSPTAYNSISITILESIYKCIGQIAGLLGEVSYHHNLGIILYKELIIVSVNHYFREYERIYDFVDSRPESGRKLLRQRGSISPHLFQRALIRSKKMVLDAWRRYLSGSLPRVGYIGSTSVSWDDLAEQCHHRGILLFPVKPGAPMTIHKIEEQKDSLFQWLDELHQTLAIMIGDGEKIVNPIDRESLLSLVVGLSKTPANISDPIDLLLSGTIGDKNTRIVALQAQAKGIPLMTLNHGSNMRVMDEPYLLLYEDVLPDAIVDYGDARELRAKNVIGRSRNLAGRSIEFYSRPDTFTKSIFRDKGIKSIISLEGLDAVYIGAGGWQEVRLGPHHDVHPSTYLRWQEQMLFWLESQTGRKPYLRLHPKRASDRYDPKGFEILDGTMRDTLGKADLLVFDYPTSPTSHICATDKPVLFFDIGLRRLHPLALDAIRGRCHYAKVNIMDPDEGFVRMEVDLPRMCKHTFVPRYSLTEDFEQTEVDAVADAIAQFLLSEG